MIYLGIFIVYYPLISSKLIDHKLEQGKSLYMFSFVYHKYLEWCLTHDGYEIDFC